MYLVKNKIAITKNIKVHDSKKYTQYVERISEKIYMRIDNS